MNEFVSFSYCGNSIRTAEKDGQLWWVLKDVCRALDISNPSKVAERLDDDERANLKLGRQGNTWLVNESGLYSVILRSDKPEAKPFRRWITSEVLPSIRRTGGYSIQRSIAVTAEKTWCGEKVISVVDIGKLMGISRSSARSYVIRYLHDGLDYFVLKGNSLQLYRHENPTEMKCGSSVMLVRADAFYNFLKDRRK